MKNSRDEAFYLSSIKKEKKMYTQVYRLKKLLEKNKLLIKKQTKIDEF